MTVQNTSESDMDQRLAWFRAARFGVFIHWGLYAQLGRWEWVMNLERIPIPDYEKLADSWKPKPNAAREWAKLAKQAGMRYMVMTTKHHEGFCLFDSALTDYNAVKHGPGRDLVAEFVEAARAEGLKVGLYYSLMDWHHPDGVICRNDEAARRRFVDYTHGLVRELMTNYGKVDILWYDGMAPLTSEGWEADKLNSMARSLQPHIIINDRAGIPEDFGTPEQTIDPARGGRMWETCWPMNDSWGYSPIDKNWKSTWHVLRMLRTVAADAGNLLLNVSPSPLGEIPPESVKVLKQVGRWMKKNGPTIYEATDRWKALYNIPNWTWTGQLAFEYTVKGSTLYLHVNRWAGRTLPVGGLVNKVLSARFYNGPAIKFTQKGQQLWLENLPEKAPDPFDTVIEVEVEGEPTHARGPLCVVPSDPPGPYASC